MGLGDKIKAWFTGESVNSESTSDEVEIAEREDMIEGVGQLDQKVVKEIMVPRIDVTFISAVATYNEVIETISTQGYSRYPVFKDNLDDICGILYAKDILRTDVAKNFDVKAIMRPAYFVPDSKHLDDLLRDFKKRHVHIAVAVDEYGGVSGIVCMEDIMEVIFGEIQDEFDDEEEEEITEVDPDTFLCEGRTPLEEINETLGLSISEEESETLGGYVFELFGRIPNVGESVSSSEAEFTVSEMDGHKIQMVKITKTDKKLVNSNEK